MNSNKLISLLHEVRLLKFVNPDELQQLANDYPYFQQAHTLLAKKYLIDNNPQFEDKLHIAALYASDRSYLRCIMLGNMDNTVSPEKTEFIIEEEELTHASMADMLPLNDSLLEEENDDAMAEENTVTEAEAMEELEAASQPSDSTNEDELVHASMGDMLPVDATLLEEENYDVVVEENITTEATAMEELEAVATQPVKTNGFSTKENFNIEQPHTFSDWLKYIQSMPRSLQHTSSAPDYQPITVPETLPEPMREQPAVEELVFIEHNPDILVAEPADNLQAIDEFVAESATSTQLVKEIPIKQLADKSVEENDELLTETLAQIYAEQQLYNKAIRVYAKLSLKFPEKSVYFASLIKELKSKL